MTFQNKQRTIEVANKIIEKMGLGFIEPGFQARLLLFLSSLPEFEEPEWTECSNKMPGMTMFTWVYSSANPHLGALQSFYDNRGFSCGGTPRYHEGITHWMECDRPEAPVNKESDLVKSVRHVFHDRYPSMSSCEANAMAEVIDEIKRYEKEAQK